MNHKIFLAELRYFIAILLFFGLTANIPLFAQKPDTIWLNGNYKRVEKSKALYFRFTKFDAQRKKWYIEDFFVNGKPQMYGWSDSPDAEHMVDSVFRYFSNGRLESVCEHKTYESGWISFFDDKMRRTCRIFCEKQLKNGKAIFYNEDGSVFSKALFKNDTMFSGTRPHVICFNHRNPFSFVTYKKGKAVEEVKLYPSGKIAMKAKLKNGLFKPGSAEFWDEKGKIIGSCTFAQGYKEPLDGTYVEYLDSDKTFDFYAPAIVFKIVIVEKGKPVHARYFDQKGSLLAECTYKNGLPFNGQHVEGTQIMTYLDGANTGWNTYFTKNFGKKRFDVQVLNGQGNGETHYFGPDGSVASTGTWRDGRPFSGRVFQNGELCDYVEGKRTGVCQTFFEDGTLESMTHFNNDTIEGESTYRSKNGLFQTKGTYRAGERYEGTFTQGGNQRISLRYDAGNLVETTYFYPDTFVVQRIETNKNGVTKEFDQKGRQIFEGEVRDGKRFSGRFRDKYSIFSYENGQKHGVCEILNYDGKPSRIEQYAHGKLDGETIFYKNGKIAARGVYKNGQPYEGRFIEGEVSGSHGIYEYRDSLKNGMAFIFNNPVQATVPYVGGQREGTAQFSWTKYINNEVDTFYLTGVYKNNKPFEGDFIDANRQEHYKDGLLEGQIKYFSRTVGGDVVKTENYRAGKLDGETIVVYNKRQFVGQFREGIAWSGWHEVKSGPSYQKTFVRMEEGAPTADKFEYIDGYKDLETRNGVPFSGFSKDLKEPYSKHFYTNGERTVTIVGLPYSRDTLGIVKYSGDKATMFDPNGRVLEKTVFTKKYDSGTTDIFSTEKGSLVGHIVFEENKLKEGYFRHEEHIQPEKRRWGMAQFSKQGDSIVVETSVKNSPLTIVRKSSMQFDIPWPMNFDVFLNDFGDKKNITEYHHYLGQDAKPPFKAIATLENDGEGHLKGYLIQESSWGYSISKYEGNFYPNETVEHLTWKQVLEQLENWKKK